MNNQISDKPITELTDTEIDERLAKVEEAVDERINLLAYDGPDRMILSDEYVREFLTKAQLPKIKSGFPSLDHRFDGGFEAGEVIVIAGPTGHGKTLLVQSLVHNLAKADIKSAVFSYEVGTAALIKRFGISGDMPIFSLPLQIVPSKLDWLEEKIKEGIAKHGIRAVMIDHLHYLMEMGDLARTKSASLLIGMIMRRLNVIAQETNTVIFLVSHLRKTKMEQEPTIEDIRDSSFIAQESKGVLLIWRTTDGEGNFTKEAYLSVCKASRTGELGATKLVYVNGILREAVSNGNN